MAMTDAQIISALHEALDEAKTGLEWYRERYPESSDGSDDEAMERINAALALVDEEDPLLGHLAAAFDHHPPPMPKTRDVGRLGDMSTTASMRVGFDSDNDVFVAVYGDEPGAGSVEFCTSGNGGGKSPETRLALIALMIAMEKDNAADPGRDWWGRRGERQSKAQGGEHD